MCDLFYKVVLDIVGLLLETKSSNTYVLIAIKHYSKWFEARSMKDLDSTTTTKFLEIFALHDSYKKNTKIEC
jgi:hypothetical protein